MYHYAWFISFALSAVCYLVLMKAGGLRGISEPARRSLDPCGTAD